MDGAIREQNALLAAGGVALRLERRGERLGLRGPLPCRLGSGALVVQRLSLGLPADAKGLEQARLRLRRVMQQLQQGSFVWSQWVTAPPRRRRGAPALPAGDEPPALALEQALQRFEGQFLADPRRRRNPAGSRTTWTAAYLPYLRRLRRLAADNGQDAAARGLQPALLQQVLESYPLASRGRQQCGTALAALAKAEGLELPADWGERAGGYGLHAAQFRQLPSDRQILEALERIPNPGWRLAYGLMATYGLRNHEVFFTDLAALAPGGDRVIRVLPTSKTGEHQVWPFQPEWVERFELPRLGEARQLLPPVCTDLRRTTLQQVGRRVAEQFRRYDLPFTPYDLRHAWAVRTIHIGLPDTVAARMMGHSVAIHTRTYHHWITRRDQQQAVDAALARVRAA
jgi:integrase